MKTFCIIPTYNEKDNISRLIEALFHFQYEDFTVLVVDDNSPDGTGEEVEKLRGTHPTLQIIHRREKLGLGTAYVEGFQKALTEGAERIIQMDADWSHDPKYIPLILEALKEADLVLGSRYIPGGGIENWSAVRKAISRFGNLYARAILRVSVKDLTGGFKCYRRKALEAIGLDGLSSVGYNFQIETTYKAYKKGFRVREIPIVFTERKLGQSKFNIRIILESFWKVIKLAYGK